MTSYGDWSVGLWSSDLSSVWLTLLITIAWFVAAFLAIFRSEAAPLPIAKVRLLLALLMTRSEESSVGLLAVIVSLPSASPLTLALTLPAPISVEWVLRTIFAVSVITALPPSSCMVP